MTTTTQKYQSQNTFKTVRIAAEINNKTGATKNNMTIAHLLRRPARGFSLIELMLVISILGILFALATPDLEIYLVNQKIRASATSIQNGIQLARSEAVKRNQPVSFVLTK